ncbi:MAG: type II toxin-antitoxin system RelE family toxin [Thermoplasmata archaeon]
MTHQKAKDEFAQLPPDIREEFLYAIRGLLFQPFRPGPGYWIKELSDQPGLWRLRLASFRRLRMYYSVDGDLLKIYGFGPREGFYVRLRQTDRLSR